MTAPDVAHRDAQVAAAATRLWRATRTRTPCSPVRDVIGVADLDRAYAVQQELIARAVADNASSGLFVLGPERHPLSEVEPVAVEMTMRVNGTVVSTGTGAACLGDPLRALAWLAEQAHRYDAPLRAGQLVLSGALGPMYPVGPGDRVEIDLSGFDPLVVVFGPAEEGA